MNIPSIWAPTPSATNTPVADLSKLVGLQIPTPIDGYFVFVVDTGGGPGSGADYELSLTSGKTVDGRTVLPTSLGGTSRWLLQVEGNANSSVEVVYQAGAVSPVAPFYSSFSTAYLAGYKRGRPFTIWVDDSDASGNAVIDPLLGGAPYDLSQCSVRSLNILNGYGVGINPAANAFATPLKVQNGVLISGWSIVDGLRVQPDIAVVNVITTVQAPQGYLFLVNGAQFFGNPTPGAPAFFRVETFLQINVSEYSTFSDSGGAGSPLCEIGTPVTGGGELDVFLSGDGPFVDLHLLRDTDAGAPPGIVTVQLASNTARQCQAGGGLITFATKPIAFTGTFTFNNSITSSRNYLWQPNGNSGPDIYATWDGSNGLFAALQSFPQGHHNIIIDNQFADPVIPDGDWALTQFSTLTFEGLGKRGVGPACTLQVGSGLLGFGADLVGVSVLRFRNCNVNMQIPASLNVLDDTTNGPTTIIFEEGSRLTQPDGAGALLHGSRETNHVSFRDNSSCNSLASSAISAPFQVLGNAPNTSRLVLTVNDSSSVSQNSVSEDVAGVVSVIQTSPTALFFLPQFIAASDIRGGVYCGSATIDGVSGKSPAITTDIYGQAIPVTAKTKITAFVRVPLTDTNTKGYAALTTDRVNAGASGGSFKISALLVGGSGGAVNIADGSTVDWIMEVPNA